MNNDSGKATLLARSLTHTKANELRSLLMRSVRNVWVMVMSTKDRDKFDVYIANEWGGSPTELQSSLSMTLATGLDALGDDEEITKDQIIELHDDDILPLSE